MAKGNCEDDDSMTPKFKFGDKVTMDGRNYVYLSCTTFGEQILIDVNGDHAIAHPRDIKKGWRRK